MFLSPPLFFPAESGRSGGDLSGADVSGFGAWNPFFLGGGGNFLFFIQLNKKLQMSELSERTFPVLRGLLALPISTHIQEFSERPVEAEDSESIFPAKSHPDPETRPC